MSERIKNLYKKANVPMRRAGIKKGKGIHTEAAHQCVINYLKKGFRASEAWKRCVGGLGKAAINPSHRRRKVYKHILGGEK